MTLQWFLFAAPGTYPVIRFLTLAGFEGPRFETNAGIQPARHVLSRALALRRGAGRLSRRLEKSGVADDRHSHPIPALLGDTWELDASLHDADGAALNLANADEIEWNLRNSGKVIVAALRLSNGVEITNAAGGLCRITLSPTRTTCAVGGHLHDEIRVTMSDGTVSTQAVGAIVATGPDRNSRPIWPAIWRS